VRLTTLLMGLVALIAVPTSVQLALSGAPTTDRLISATYVYATQSPDTAAIYINALEQGRPADSHGTLTRARQKVAVRQAMAAVRDKRGPQSTDLFARSHVRESNAPVSADSRCRIAPLLVGRDQARTSVACEGAG